jgi:acetyltransferase-like isoleucine patch superfamily enzyme
VLGAGVALGPEVLLVTLTHEIGSAARRAGTPKAAPIVVHDGAWIGGRSTILPGVEVGEGAVVAAGAVVVDNVPPHSIVAGVPAVVVRTPLV